MSLRTAPGQFARTASSPEHLPEGGGPTGKGGRRRRLVASAELGAVAQITAVRS